jgi:uncharacterized protein (DUF2252 family)
MSLIERIRHFDSGLLKPQLKQKYKTMAQSPFRFFRGTAALFYDDLARQKDLSDCPVCWLCGDMHIENFGSFKGDNKLVYFDVNDFDEALLGPVCWDLVRAVSSIYTVCHSLKIPARQATKAAKIFLERYASVLSEGKALYVDANTATDIVRYFLKSTRERSQGDQLEEMTHLNREGKIRLKKDGKELVKLSKTTKADLSRAFYTWMRSNAQPPNHFKVIDVCFHSTGTGSLGGKRYLFLIRKLSDKKKFRLIEMKEATPSVAQPYSTSKQPSWHSEADRIVSIQKRMQYTSPAQLSTLIFKDEPFVMQQMQPSSDKVNFDLIKDRFGDVCSVMKDMALLNASAHLRSVSRDGSCSADELIAFGKDKAWRKAVLAYGKNYSTRINAYYAEFCKGYKTLLKKTGSRKTEKNA